MLSDESGEGYQESAIRCHTVIGTLNLHQSHKKIERSLLLSWEVAVALMGGRYVSTPCAGGGSVSSETGWDGRKKDEENEGFRLRCWLHAAKTVKASRYVPTKRKGYGR